jgi:hypothetical protein
VSIEVRIVPQKVVVVTAQRVDRSVCNSPKHALRSRQSSFHHVAFAASMAC